MDANTALQKNTRELPQTGTERFSKPPWLGVMQKPEDAKQVLCLHQGVEWECRGQYWGVELSAREYQADRY